MDELAMMCTAQHPRLVGMLALYCGDQDVAENLAQEALVRLCRDWDRVGRLRSPEARLHRVATNLAHSHYRRKAIENRAVGIFRGRTSEELQPSTTVETLELLQPLPHRQKVALLLHYYLDMTLVDVAAVMRIPVGSARTLIRRGSQWLRTSASLLEANDGI